MLARNTAKIEWIPWQVNSATILVLIKLPSEAAPYPGSQEYDFINFFSLQLACVCVILPLSSKWIFLYSLPRCAVPTMSWGYLCFLHNTYVNTYIDTPSHTPHIEACPFTHTKSFLPWEKCRGWSQRTFLHLWASAVFWAKTAHDHPLAFVGTSSVWRKGLWEGRCSSTHNGQPCSAFILLHGLIWAFCHCLLVFAHSS